MCLLQFHLIRIHVYCICTRPPAMAIWPFPMSLTVASNQQSYLYTCAYKHACLKHLLRTSIHICYSNIQPSVLSVALATDQRSSNGCYNCTRQAGPYQPAVKMVTNICSMQIPYSGVVFCVDTLHSITFFCKFYPSIELTFFHILIQKRFVVDFLFIVTPIVGVCNCSVLLYVTLCPF